VRPHVQSLRPQARLRRPRRKSPSLVQPGVTYFVTFRTADSVPQPLLRTWYDRRDRWLREQQLDPQSPDWKARWEADPEVQREFNRTFTREFMEYLDQGYGACVLKNGRAANCVADALKHFDGERYHLGDFVVMPNHVHAIIGLIGATAIEAQCKSWKRYSATEINCLTGARGRFWQEEAFDHLVRSPEQFDALRQYIADNPKKAGLKTGEYLYYRRPDP
jgi:type I restriction enzyme R subunit